MNFNNIEVIKEYPLNIKFIPSLYELKQKSDENENMITPKLYKNAEGYIFRYNLFDVLSIEDYVMNIYSEGKFCDFLKKMTDDLKNIFTRAFDYTCFYMDISDVFVNSSDEVIILPKFVHEEDEQSSLTALCKSIINKSNCSEALKKELLQFINENFSSENILHGSDFNLGVTSIFKQRYRERVSFDKLGSEVKLGGAVNTMPTMQDIFGAYNSNTVDTSTTTRTAYTTPNDDIAVQNILNSFNNGVRGTNFVLEDISDELQKRNNPEDSKLNNFSQETEFNVENIKNSNDKFKSNFEKLLNPEQRSLRAEETDFPQDFSQNLQSSTFSSVQQGNNVYDSIPYLKNTRTGDIYRIAPLPFTIGKLNSNNLCIENPYISKKHATIFEENGSYYLQDENSSNYTYINGQRLENQFSYKLMSGCTVTFAREEFLFYVE